ncbi:hypothetical protein [Desulforhopalus sp. IMCC35007]|uniref:hypothetical protein n=1 Tax=Desulforhopalus sp. IMCC35007 TaxID=2569543 RepID=UPI0010AE64D8|nr:hypothetical protein [Desulforhopalus sp. IMCC35007]TKB07211.1 hypothetical protein FCL48_18405 [Desulforhopalus sp. IMCC35007]
MSIRLMAKDLYAAQQNVDQLEKKMAESSTAELLELSGELKLALKERDMLRRMLDGEKESGKFRQKFEGFGRTKK